MLRLLLIVIFAGLTIYNLTKYVQIKIKAEIETYHFISFFIMLVLLGVIFAKILVPNTANYGLGLAFVLFYISSVITRGITKEGIYDRSIILSIATFTKWGQVKDIDFEYNKDGYLDVVIASDSRAIRQRYAEVYEETFLKIRKKIEK